MSDTAYGGEANDDSAEERTVPPDDHRAPPEETAPPLPDAAADVSPESGGGPPPGALAYWSFDEQGGTLAADRSGNQNDVTLERGATFASGVRGNSLTLGNQQFGATAGPVLDTTHPFTVSAWVKLSRLSGYACVISQDGSVARAFNLRFDGTVNKFAWMMAESDSSNPREVGAFSQGSPIAGTYYHLAGTYDGKALALYEDGVLQQTQSFATPWNAQGPVEIGRAKWQTYQGDYLDGSIDEVRLFDRVLTPAEITDLHTAR